MVTQSEDALEKGLIKTLTDMAYEYVVIGGEKAKKLCTLKEFELENGERVWLEFLNKGVNER